MNHLKGHEISKGLIFCYLIFSQEMDRCILQLHTKMDASGCGSDGKQHLDNRRLFAPNWINGTESESLHKAAGKHTF